MELKTYTINLETYQSNNSDVFSGRDNGEHVREKINLSEIEDKFDSIIVRVPKDTLTINPSFFLGLFGDSVRKYGEEKFRKKFEFQCEEIILPDIDEGIEWALKRPEF